MWQSNIHRSSFLPYRINDNKNNQINKTQNRLKQNKTQNKTETERALGGGEFSLPLDMDFCLTLIFLHSR